MFKESYEFGLYIASKIILKMVNFVILILTAELAQKARREIADYINNGKEERARIRVSKLFHFSISLF